MPIYPDTNDQRRIYNSDAKTLLQNWVEEREVKKFDKIPDEFLQNEKQPPIKYYKSGHKGLITVEEDSPYFKQTTYKDDFIKTSNYDPNGEAKGIRYKLTEQLVTKKLLEDMRQEENLINDFFDEPTNFVSEAHEKFSVPGFVSQPPKPIARHDVYSEMPVSYWTEKKNRAHGITQVKTLDSPFRRNAAFSTPGSETYETAKPNEIENYPYMSEKSNNTAAIL